MNRESLPLIITLLVPIFLAFIVFLYYKGIDMISFFKEIPVIYYIIMAPIILGFLVAIIKWMRPD